MMKTPICIALVLMLCGCIPIGIRGTSITAVDARQCGMDIPKETPAALPKGNASATGARCG
jgi:hypothetical protein